MVLQASGDLAIRPAAHGPRARLLPWAAAALLLMSVAGVAAAQTDAIRRTVLQRMDVAGENKEMIMAIIEETSVP